jgi:hypothetical protein
MNGGQGLREGLVGSVVYLILKEAQEQHYRDINTYGY